MEGKKEKRSLSAPILVASKTAEGKKEESEGNQGDAGNDQASAVASTFVKLAGQAAFLSQQLASNKRGDDLDDKLRSGNSVSGQQSEQQQQQQAKVVHVSLASGETAVVRAELSPAQAAAVAATETAAAALQQLLHGLRDLMGRFETLHAQRMETISQQREILAELREMLDQLNVMKREREAASPPSTVTAAAEAEEGEQEQEDDNELEQFFTDLNFNQPLFNAQSIENYARMLPAPDFIFTAAATRMMQMVGRGQASVFASQADSQYAEPAGTQQGGSNAVGGSGDNGSPGDDDGDYTTGGKGAYTFSKENK